MLWVGEEEEEEEERSREEVEAEKWKVKDKPALFCYHYQQQDIVPSSVWLCVLIVQINRFSSAK